MWCVTIHEQCTGLSKIGLIRSFGQEFSEYFCTNFFNLVAPLNISFMEVDIKMTGAVAPPSHVNVF